MGVTIHNWRLVLKDAQDAINTGCEETWVALSKQLGIPKSSLQDGFRREYGITATTQIKDYKFEDINYSYENYIDDAFVKVDESKDTSEIEYRSQRITTLEQMLEICKVDLNIWEVERYIVNKWEVGVKSQSKTLAWENGKIIQGNLSTKAEVIVEPLFQIKVWLKRKNTEISNVSLSPIQINVQILKKPVTKKHGIKTAAIIPDIHVGFSTCVNNSQSKLIPFHDRKALDVALQIVEMENVDTLIYLGDILDLAEWTSHFVRSPEYYFNTQSSITEAAWWMTQFRLAAQNSEQSYIEGNHELRIQTAVIQNLSPAYNIKTPESQYPVLSIPNFLGLDRINVKYVPGYPNNYVWLGDDILCTHGNTARSNAGATVAKIIDEHNTTIIQGHIHRHEMVSRTIHLRDETKIIQAFSPGCLCKIDGTVPGSSARSQWQQGIAIIHFDVDSGNNTIISVPIRHGMAIHNGYMIKYRDRLSNIQKDTNWDF